MKYFTLCLASLIFLFSSLTTAETKIYQWIDEQGKVHFSDAAQPGVKNEEVSIGEHNLLINDSSNQLQQDNELPIAPEPENNEYTQYLATITSPEDDSPIRSNDGSIEIHVKTTPEKENKQKLQLFLDGKKLGAPQISPTIRASNIDRGTHQAQVHLLDENGKLLAKTQIVTVHLLR